MYQHLFLPLESVNTQARRRNEEYKNEKRKKIQEKGKMNYFDIPIAGPIFHSSSSYKAQSKSGRPAPAALARGCRDPAQNEDTHTGREEKSCCWGDGLINLFAVDWQKKCRSCSPCCRSCFPIRSAYTHTHNTHTIESFTFFYFFIIFSFSFYIFSVAQHFAEEFCQKKKGEGTLEKVPQ